MKYKDVDFTGIATAYDVLCSDGRRIKEGAFDHQDGVKVPLVWRHKQDDMGNILGHAFLEKSEKPPGVRVYAKFNDSDNGKKAKTLVKHGDLSALSIYANELTEEQVGDEIEVRHGTIREVSLVLSGANRGAWIEQVLYHDALGLVEGVEENALIFHSGESIEVVEHEEDTGGQKTVADILKTLTTDQKMLMSALMADANGVFHENSEIIDLDVGDDSEGLDLSRAEEIYQTLTDEQVTVINYMVDEYHVQEENKSAKHSTEENDQMTQAIFNQTKKPELIHDGTLNMQALNGTIAHMAGARVESLRKELNKKALEHGITNIDTLFPEYKDVVSGAPDFFKEPDGWVTTVMNKVKKFPYARLRTQYADITEDEARARGYITGDQKLEEVFPVFQRVTGPQTVYKLQKLDRDHIIDITDFDVVVWLKAEMKVMLKLELARALLISDGREVTAPDKIKVEHIRPIWGDDPFYTIYHEVPEDADWSDVIDEAVRSQINYMGSGNVDFFGAPEVVTEMMLVKDYNQRRIYRSEQELSSAMRVGSLVQVPVMREKYRQVNGDTFKLLGIIVDLKDYGLGMDRMGKMTFFEDFDLNFNKHEYLYESRQSGTLLLPKSAVVLEQKVTVETQGE